MISNPGHTRSIPKKTNISAAKNKLKIAISYPPLPSAKGTPFLSQNRQFQWTNTGNVIYPVIPAYGATALKQLGHQVLWDDAIAQKLSYDEWLNRLVKFQPDIIFIESKTPVIKTHWQIINELKKISLNFEDWQLKIVLMGDHVTALPQESLLNSSVDYVLTGGDFDFMMVSLANHISRGAKLEPGFWFRTKAPKHQSAISNSGPFALKHHNLDDLPIIDRELTQWHLYALNNTNYKYLPGAYIMSGRDCWWGKCTFCSWTTLYPHTSFRTHSPDFVIREIENLVNNFNVKEIFDDAGTMPIGPWLQEFCQKIIAIGLNKKVTLGCNMRFGALNQNQYNLLAQAGFRFILYGLESSNQKTLEKINKLTKPEDARKTLIMAKKAGLEPHLTIMIGYPWESYQDAQNTLNEARSLFKDGLADSMQATRIIPYPGTPLFDYCQKENLLTTSDWNEYDMRTAIIKSPITDQKQQQLIQGLFKGILTPKFIIRKIKSIRNYRDFIFLARYTLKYIQKLRDFPFQNALSKR